MLFIFDSSINLLFCGLSTYASIQVFYNDDMHFAFSDVRWSRITAPLGNERIPITHRIVSVHAPGGQTEFKKTLKYLKPSQPQNLH